MFSEDWHGEVWNVNFGNDRSVYGLSGYRSIEGEYVLVWIVVSSARSMSKSYVVVTENLDCLRY